MPHSPCLSDLPIPVPHSPSLSDLPLPLTILQGYRPGTLYSDIESGDPRRKHFSDRGDAAAAPGAGGRPMPPSMPDLPHAGLGLGATPGAGLGFGPGGMPVPAPVDDGSFAGGWVGVWAFGRMVCMFLLLRVGTAHLAQAVLRRAACDSHSPPCSAPSSCRAWRRRRRRRWRWQRPRLGRRRPPRAAAPPQRGGAAGGRGGGWVPGGGGARSGAAGRAGGGARHHFGKRVLFLPPHALHGVPPGVCAGHSGACWFACLQCPGSAAARLWACRFREGPAAARPCSRRGVPCTAVPLLQSTALLFQGVPPATAVPLLQRHPPTHPPTTHPPTHPLQMILDNKAGRKFFQRPS